MNSIGQMNNVKVIKLIMKNSVEEKMLQIQKRKKELAGAVTGVGSSKLNLDELMSLFD